MVLKRVAKEVLSRTPFRRAVFPYYSYQFTPPQLMLLCELLDDARAAAGAIAEIGCSTGATTIFLNRFMDAAGIEKPYFALDTFRGFVPEDVRTEVNKRGKSASHYTGFRANSRKSFDATMRDNGISRVVSIEADVNHFDLATLGTLAFVLLDVDLYRPIKHALPPLWQALSPGGAMVVDDCNPADKLFDGAAQAYYEFTQQIGITPDVRLGKLGLLRR